MKKLLFLALMVLGLTVQLRAAPYGYLIFNNASLSGVTNSITGTPVVSGNTFHVGLYVAPDGTTDDWLFTFVAGSETNFFAPGRFNRSAISVPPIAPNTYGMFQVRVWETAYGSTYEAAAANSGLVGKSTIMRILVSDLGSPPPSTASSGLSPIWVGAAPQPSFYINSILISEGTNGTKEAVFKVTLSPPAAATATVDFATQNGTALAGSDYVATNGTLTFAAGERTNSVSVTLTPDPDPESDEQFYVSLTNNVGALIAQGLGTCVITEVRVVGLRLDAAITFNTVAGHHYMVERTDDLVTWTPVTGAENVTGTGTVNTVYDQGVGGQGLRVYRARLLD